MVSFIIPTYNEELDVEKLLQDLSRQAGGGCEFEVIVADGSSSDHTAALAERYARVVVTERNRGLQLNAAVRHSQGEILCFLHADVRLPAGALGALCLALSDPEVVGGSFSLEFSGGGFASRVFTFVNGWRRKFGVFYGDSGIFVRRSVFEKMGGFREWPVLEDYEFARRLVEAGRTICLPERLRVSSRRWQSGQGRRGRLGSTLASWFFLQAGYSLGLPAAWLARWYPPVRESRLAGGRHEMPLGGQN